MKMLSNEDLSGILDQIVKAGRTEASVCNAKPFFKGQKVEIYKKAGGRPIGKRKIESVSARHKTIKFTSPLPKGTEAGDFIVVEEAYGR
jgi:hypothetical protein